MERIIDWIRYRRYRRIIGLDKSLDEIFKGLEHLPKAPVNRRHML